MVAPAQLAAAMKRARHALDAALGWWRERPRLRLVTFLAAVALWLVLLHGAFDTLTAGQQPTPFWDTRDYLDTARQELSFAHLFHPKPFVVPAMFRLLDNDHPTIQAFQERLAFASWSLLGVVLLFTVRRPLARLLVVLAITSLTLAPLRLGWTATLLSESASDSLLALLLAGAAGLILCMRLGPSWRRAAACAAVALVLVVTGTLWVLARDTNAATLLVAAPLALVIWRPLRAWAAQPMRIVLLAAAIAVPVFALWTASAVPREPYGIKSRTGWLPEATARSVYPMVDNVLARILPDRDAVAFFAARGMPLSDDLRRYRGRLLHADLWYIMAEPQHLEFFRWVRAHGMSTYVLWLLRRPLRTANELVDHVWEILATRDLPDGNYMPKGWMRTWPNHAVLDELRKLGRSSAFLALLLLATPLFVLRTPRSALRDLGLFVTASGLLAGAAAYFGDAMEVNRHCYGSAQHLVCGLLLLGLAFADRTLTAGRAGPIP